jgi:hypothetical protein
VCQWAGHAQSWARAAHLPAFDVVVGPASLGRPSAIGTWQGWPSCLHLGGTWQHRTLPGGKGGPGPRGQSGRTCPQGSGSHTWRRRTPRPLGGSGPVETNPEHPVLVGTWRRRTYKSTGGDPEIMIPVVKLGPYTSSPKGQGCGHG